MKQSRGETREAWPLYGLGAILVVTVGWWAGALWPLPASTPEWVARARAACFGSTESGLPNAGGWILLLGTPPAMVGALLIMGGKELRAGLRSLAAKPVGRWGIRVTVLSLSVLAVLAAVRVLEASGRFPIATAEAAFSAEAPLKRLDHAAPPLALTDQHGGTIGLDRFRGRPVLVTFAYAKCETVCPVIVHNVLAAREEIARLDPVVLIVSLDPWRDPPARLPHIAAAWKLDPDSYVLSGSVEEVEATLDAWQVARSRDLRTGEIAHPSLVFVIDADGRVAFAVSGNTEQIVQAAQKL